MSTGTRCLYNTTFSVFLHSEDMTIFGELNDSYHGPDLTTQRNAWKSEIEIMRKTLEVLAEQDGRIIFEYDIPRLGKRIDVVLLYRGIVFCIEFKVGEKRILEPDVDQVLDYALDLKNFHKYSRDNVTYSDDLHLAVSLRSYRAEKLSAFVHQLLSLDKEAAAATYREIKDRYPIVLTRDMGAARKWLHDRACGSERTGVLVTKESARFKPMAVHILPSDDEKIVHWFLDDKTDTRSSYYLEDAATEIQVQGLELDYTCLLWDADMRYDNGRWRFYRFNGRDDWS